MSLNLFTNGHNYNKRISEKLYHLKTYCADRVLHLKIEFGHNKNERGTNLQPMGTAVIFNT